MEFYDQVFNFYQKDCWIFYWVCNEPLDQLGRIVILKTLSLPIYDHSICVYILIIWFLSPMFHRFQKEIKAYTYIFKITTRYFKNFGATVNSTVSTFPKIIPRFNDWWGGLTGHGI